MIALDSGIENQAYSFEDIENILKRLNFEVGGNWEYDHAYFDCLLNNDEHEYAFLRIPVSTEIGIIGEKNAHVRVGKPFVLVHRYEDGIDHDSISGNIQASFNQFSAPEDSDAEVDQNYIQKAQDLLIKVEHALLQ
ncbi:YugN family protein [Alkalibacillus aidingensis]|uniref:YugN family protein n=1 Tax=Alkalibacillus aidingensis TaxID=2747607 RepID=UPI00166077BB|nr:YugN family protein [Alkalibacillus aidingensis]